MRDLTLHSLAGMDALDLVKAAVSERASFKFVARELEKRPPSKAAAEEIIDAYRRGDAPPWLAALLLGRCRDKVGYTTVREILLSAPRQLAESYAGVALAEIGGDQALDDLKQLMFDAPDRKSREGAAFGLRALSSSKAASAIFEAVLAGKIRWETGAWILSGKFADENLLLKLLQSGDKYRVRIATEIVCCSILNPTKDLPEEMAPFVNRPSIELVRALGQVLSDSQMTMAPNKRTRLRDWLNRVSCEESSGS